MFTSRLQASKPHNLPSVSVRPPNCMHDASDVHRAEGASSDNRVRLPDHRSACAEELEGHHARARHTHHLRPVRTHSSRSRCRIHAQEWGEVPRQSEERSCRVVRTLSACTMRVATSLMPVLTELARYIHRRSSCCPASVRRIILSHTAFPSSLIFRESDHTSWTMLSLT